MLEKLIELQQDIYNYELAINDSYFVDYSSKISFFQIGDFFDITYYGDGYDDDPCIKAIDFDFETNFAFCRFLDFISDQNYADKIISLQFQGPDKGANGTKSWDFNRLINTNVTFPNLISFTVQLTDLGDHNQSIIDGKDMDEDGMITKLILKMPSLEKLILPSAPNQLFFEIGEHPLKNLKLQAGYSHQNFIENLANSSNFKHLETLDYTDIIDFSDLSIEEFTSFESYLTLFTSKAFSSVKYFKLRNATLNLEQLFELQASNNVQFLNIKAKGGRYVSHLMRNKK